VRIPKYCLHKATGQAVVWLGKRCVYLGKHGSVASKEEYERQIRDWLARGKEVGPASEMPLLTLAALYWDDQKNLRGYQDGGRRVGPIDGIHQMLQRITRAYGQMPAVEFGPQRLHEFRMRMIDEGLSRVTVHFRAAGRSNRIRKRVPNTWWTRFSTGWSETPPRGAAERGAFAIRPVPTRRLNVLPRASARLPRVDTPA